MCLQVVMDDEGGSFTRKGTACWELLTLQNTNPRLSHDCNKQPGLSRTVRLLRHAGQQIVFSTFIITCDGGPKGRQKYKFLLYSIKYMHFYMLTLTPLALNSLVWSPRTWGFATRASTNCFTLDHHATLGLRFTISACRYTSRTGTHFNEPA